MTIVNQPLLFILRKSEVAVALPPPRSLIRSQGWAQKDLDEEAEALPQCV